jgi:hypothetical protein
VRIIPRRSGPAPTADGIPPHATGTPRRAPSWPRETVINEHPFWAPIPDEIPSGLPAESRNLLTAYPMAAAHAYLSMLALLAASRRPSCRILATSAEHEYEVAVGQNLAMLADQAHPAVTR